MSDHLLIESALLRLRPFAETDLPAFVAYRNDEAVACYQGWDLPYTLEQAQQFLAELQATPPGTPGEWCQLVIERKADGAILGDTAFKLLRHDTRQAEIGCTLARAYWGQGYAVMATQALLDYLFETYDLHRVMATCDVENSGAARALEKVGMRREAHFVENLWFKGRWSSEYVYAALKSDLRPTIEGEQ